MLLYLYDDLRVRMERKPSMRQLTYRGPKEIAIVVHSRIIDYLVAERSTAFHRLESFGVSIELVDDPDAPADSYRIFHSRSLEELTPQHNQA